MKTYEFIGGGRISAENNEQLLTILNQNSLFGYRKFNAWFMHDTAKACKLQTGAEIRIGTADEFIEDLIANNFLKEIDNA